MPRGQADFGLYTPETYVAGMSDMAELAVRLGSIVIFDRRGKVIALDDCEAPVMKWYKAAPGAAAVVLNNSNPLSGAQCIKLTSGGGALEFASITKGFIILASKRLGFEFCYSLAGGSAYLDVAIENYTGTTLQEATIRIDFNGKTLSYLDDGDDFVEFATIGSRALKSYIYYPVKLVADFDTGYYVRLLFAGTEYDLSSHALYTTAPVIYPHTDYKLTLTRRVAPGSSVYVDDFIFTEDEP